MSDGDKRPSGAEEELDGLFALARVKAPEPSEALAARVLAQATAMQGVAMQGVAAPAVRTAPAGRDRRPGRAGLRIGRWVNAGGLALAGALGFAAGFAGLLDAAPLQTSLFPTSLFATSATQADEVADLNYLTDGPPGASVLLGAAGDTAE